MTFEDELAAARWNAERRGIEKGVKKGAKKGAKKERARIERENALLVDALESSGRAGELAAALRDPAHRAALLAEFGIGPIGD